MKLILILLNHNMTKFHKKDDVKPIIAIVEDDLPMSELVKRMINSEHIEIEVFSLGVQLIKSINISNFEYIILDLSLPDIDGFEIMNKLSTTNIVAKIILMSGHDMAVVRAAKVYGEGIGLNIKEILFKPFSKNEILKAIGVIK